MIPNLSQEAVTEYASEALTTQEPTGTDFTQGVRVGKTIPAKWWNWLFSAVTKRIAQSRADANNMLTELKNVVTDAGLTPSGSSNTQLAQAVVTKANTQIDKYVENKKGLYTLWYPMDTAIIDGISCSIYPESVQQAGNNQIVAIFNTLGYGISGNTAYLCVSTNGVDWHPLASIAGVFPGCGCVQFRGYSFILFTARVGTSGDDFQYTSYLLRSGNGIDWDMIMSAVTEQDTYTQSAWITVADSTLLVHRGQSEYINYSTDGDTFANFSYRSSGMTVITSGNLTLKAHSLGESTFLIGTFRINLQSLSCSALESHVRSFIGSERIGTYGAYAYSFKNLSDNIVTGIVGRPDSAVSYSQGYVLPGFSGYVFKENNNNIQFSNNGSSFDTLPAGMKPIVRYGDLCIMQGKDADGYIAIYHKANGVLSYLIDNYTEVYNANYDTPHLWSNYTVANGSFTEDIKALIAYVSNSSHADTYISLDYGHSWRETSKVGVEYFTIQPIRAYLNGRAFSGNAFSDSQINSVAGHTLYLR